MTQHALPPTWSGWSVISAHNTTAFTLWCTGLPGVGKTALANVLKQAFTIRGYRVEVIAPHTLSHWLKSELQVEENMAEDHSHTLGYDAFVTYVCTLLTQHGIIAITTSVSPYQETRRFAREQLKPFIEVYLHCSPQTRAERLRQLEHLPLIDEHIYQPPATMELSIDTEHETPERSALRVLTYLEQHGYIAPRWATNEDDVSDEEIATIKARLQALGYLD